MVERNCEMVNFEKFFDFRFFYDKLLLFMLKSYLILFREKKSIRKIFKVMDLN